MARARRSRPPREVFLSHSARDRAFASRLAGVLRDHGVPVWYSRTQIRGAQLWHDEIGAALARCDWFVLLISPNAVESRWVKRELMYALREEQYEERIVPVLYRSADYRQLSWTLDESQIIDFTKDAARGFVELLKVWGIGDRSSAETGRRRRRRGS